jgi:hypothetical protein
MRRDLYPGATPGTTRGPGAAWRWATRATVVAVALLGLQAMPVVAAAAVRPGRTIALDSFYPDPARVASGFFLSGANVAGPTPTTSDFWFAELGGGVFRQYNWAPPQSCHWDQLQWAGGVLRYDATHDGCGTANNEVDYRPGVVYMPEQWAPGSTWSSTGTSVAAYTDRGAVTCRGVNHWASRAVASGPNLYRFETTQTISWTSGSDRSGCKAGTVTRWFDSFDLGALVVTGLTVSDAALVREVGGNLDDTRTAGHWDYDVRFAAWDRLPK